MRALARRGRQVSGFVVASAGLRMSDAVACSTCIGWAKDGSVWSGGFIWSTLFLMGLPFILAGLIGGWVYYLYRRAARLRRGPATAPRLVLRQKESGQ